MVASDMKKSGFTLIELLLVIAVIGILIGVLFHGVFGVTEVANKKRNANNAKLLHAAIMEYRHDVGKWPIPDDDATGATAKTEDVEGGTSSPNVRKRKKVVWSLTYGEVDGRTGSVKGSNNDVVIEYLLNAKVGEKNTEKAFLDLHTFVTTDGGTATRYMTEETEETTSAYEWWRDHGKKGKGLAIVYKTKFVKCPVCKKYVAIDSMDEGRCDNPDCVDPEVEDDSGLKTHIFSKKELARKVDGAMPYKITFDFVNATCKVETN